MEKSIPIMLPIPLRMNGLQITHVVIGRHYREKHAAYMTDELVLDLVRALDGSSFEADSTTKGIEYYATDIELSKIGVRAKTYRLVWLLEGHALEIIGVINAYRVKKRKK